MPVITKIDPGMAAALERAKRAEIKMRRPMITQETGQVDTYVKVMRDGSLKLKRKAQATARRVWEPTKYANCRAYSRPGDA
jgi:hypothetical protein